MALRYQQQWHALCRSGTGVEMASAVTGQTRVDWVDYAKGICIILVVMMHSTLGVEKALGQTGYLSSFIEWARPFRMPDFFLISGLFLARRIHADWRSYVDSKVVHFLYFYLLWMTIQFAFKGPGMFTEFGALGVIREYALALIEPFGTLWFIYLLAIFFVVTKLLKGVPPVMVFVMAALLEALPIHTGWIVIDEFAARFVYFFAGYWLAPLVFRAADQLWARNVFAVLALLYIWSTGHSLAMIHGFADTPVMSLVLGFAGAGAVITTAVLLARSGLANGLRYLGANSIVVYLAFFLPMAITRTLGLKLLPNINVDLLSAATTAAGIVGPLIFFWLIRKTPLSVLFKRPAWATLKRVESDAARTYSAAHDKTLLNQS
jgi:uncharacterized membrane protein YcfT